MDPTAAPRPPDAPRPPFWAGLGGLLVVAGGLYLTGLGWTDLWAPDEPRYAAIAEELRSMRHGLRGLFLLHVNEAVYTQKPPLWFWLAALAGSPAGRVDEVAARLPSALAAFASLGLTAWIGRQLRLSPRVALLATALLATSYRFVFVARRAQLDGVLTTCLLAGIALFLWIDRPQTPDRDRRPRPPRVAALHLALGAGALTKGPVAWLPLAIFAAFLAWEGRIRDFRRIAPPWAFGLSVGPLVLWALAAVAMAPSGYFDVAIVDNVFGRFFSGTSHVRPFYYFVLQLPVEFLPWSVALPLGVLWLYRTARPAGEPASQARAARLLTCWIAFPFLFFSFSAGKRGLYLLPILPALAIATAAGLDGFLRRRLPSNGDPERLLAAVVVAVALLQGALFLGVGPLLLEPHKSPRPVATEALAILREDEVLGVYRLGPLEPALTYYGVDRIVSLAETSTLAAFLEARRGPVLLRTRDYAALAGSAGLRETSRLRRGPRSLSFVRPLHEIPKGKASVRTEISPSEPRRTHQIPVCPRNSTVFGNAHPAAGGPPPLLCSRSGSPLTPASPPTRKPPSTRRWPARSSCRALPVRRMLGLTGGQVPGKVRLPTQPRPAMAAWPGRSARMEGDRRDEEVRRAQRMKECAARPRPVRPLREHEGRRRTS